MDDQEENFNEKKDGICCFNSCHSSRSMLTHLSLPYMSHSLSSLARSISLVTARVDYTFFFQILCGREREEGFRNPTGHLSYFSPVPQHNLAQQRKLLITSVDPPTPFRLKRLYTLLLLMLLNQLKQGIW